MCGTVTCARKACQLDPRSVFEGGRAREECLKEGEGGKMGPSTHRSGAASRPSAMGKDHLFETQLASSRFFR
jgi:hypothetical protein